MKTHHAQHPDVVVLERALGRVAEVAADLRDEETSVGWPKSTRRDTPGRGTVLDDQGVPMAPVSDPVGELVAGTVDGGRRGSGMPTGQMRAAVRRWDVALVELRAAAGLLEDVGRLPQPTVRADGSRRPTCPACGETVEGLVNGLCRERCERRWRRWGRPEHALFVQQVSAERPAA